MLPQNDMFTPPPVERAAPARHHSFALPCQPKSWGALALRRAAPLSADDLMADIITADIAAIVFISAACSPARIPLGLSDLKWLNELQQQLAF